MSIAKATIELRELVGISQETLAQKAGLQPSTIARLESGGEYNEDITERIAGVFGLNLPMLQMYGLTEEEVLENKRQVFNDIHLGIKDLIQQFVSYESEIVEEKSE